MKKILTLSLLALLLTSCSGKWNQADPEMPEELRTLHEEALEAELATLEEDPANSDALFGAAFRYQQLGDWKKAVKYYEKVLELSPADWASLNNLAYMYETMEDYDQAAFYIKKLYESDPDNTEVISDTVRILLLAGDSVSAQLALENFARVVLDSENPDTDMQIFIGELYETIYQWNQENEQVAN